MKIIHEIDSLIDFEPWSGAVHVYENLTWAQLDQLDRMLEELYPAGMTDTQVNDMLWHDSDRIAELLGFRNWEHLERVNDGAYNPIKIQCYDIDWDVDDRYEEIEFFEGDEGDLDAEDYVEDNDIEDYEMEWDDYRKGYSLRVLECSDSNINLPDSVEFVFEDEDDIEEYYEHKENGDEDDFLSDALSDEYGWCVNGFTYKEIKL